MKTATMRRLRQWHLYSGMFFAPAILLFAISGGLQTFRLHEAKGYGGTPPSWIVWIASVHRDDRLPQREAIAPVAHADHQEHAAPHEHGDVVTPAKPKMNGLALKIFAVLLSIGLSISAILGIVIALNNRATRTISLAMLAAGTALPIVLLYL